MREEWAHSWQEPFPWTHSFTSSQPGPTLMLGSSLQALAASPRLPCVLRPGCDSGPVFISTYGLRLQGGELEMITSALTLGGLAHMGPKLIYEAPSLASAVFIVKWDCVLALHRCSTIKAYC